MVTQLLPRDFPSTFVKKKVKYMKNPKLKRDTITVNAELREYVDADGLRKICIRITQNKRHIREKTDIAVKSNQWTGKTNKWVGASHDNYTKHNTFLEKRIALYKDKILDLEKTQSTVTKEDVYNAMNKEHFKLDFLGYWDLKRLDMGKYNSYKGFDCTRRKIVAYQGEKYEFKDINKDWLTKFAAHLADNGLVENSIYSEIKKIRRMWNMAISDKVIDKEYYPFGYDNYRMPNSKSKTKKIERLDATELKKFFTANYKEGTQIYYVKRGWELAFNMAGVRVEDLLTLRWSDIKDGRISYNMKKGITNGKYKSFAITPQIKSILDDLRPTAGEERLYIIPLMNESIPLEVKKYVPELKKYIMCDEEYKKEVGRKTALYNKYLKQIADGVGIKKNLVSHLARHSWAGFTFEKTKNIRLIQGNLDHEDINVTMGYIGKLSNLENDETLSTLYDDLYKTKKRAKPSFAQPLGILKISKP